MSLDAGTRVGRYTITRLVAQGGMAEVYRAEQDLAGGITRPVAVKVIRPEYSESDDFREMFLDEARTACTLSHPNIVHIYEVGESDDGQVYMAMELVTGETLATINRTLRTHDERFADEALFAIGVSTAAALEAVHALKVEGGTVNLVHRDVSPHNLLLSSSGALKLIDFGIAKAATNRNLTMPGVTKGKAGYFSPEQAMGKRLDGRSDLFSLGVTLYKLACGATPFDDHTNHAERHAALVRGQFKHLDEVHRGLPKGFYEVLRQVLQVKPEDRYQSAREVREAFEKAAFDARVRVSQSSLVGYVDDDGEITATGGSRVSAALAIVAGPTQILSSGDAEELSDDDFDEVAEEAHEVDTGPATAVEGDVTDATARARPVATPYSSQKTASLPAPASQGPMRTERLDPVSRPPVQVLFKQPMVLLAFVASVVIGVFGVMLVAGPGPLPSPTTVVTPPPLVLAKPVVTPVAAPPVAVVPTQPVVAQPVVEDVKPPPVAKAVVERPKARPQKSEPKGSPPVEKKPETPPVEAAIPPGEGKLRIAVTAPGRATLVVGAEDWGEPPLNRRVASGSHRIVVKLSDGSTASTHAPVYPDQTTIVTYDAATQRWSVSRK